MRRVKILKAWLGCGMRMCWGLVATVTNWVAWNNSVLCLTVLEGCSHYQGSAPLSFWWVPQRSWACILVSASILPSSSLCVSVCVFSFLFSVSNLPLPSLKTISHWIRPQLG